MEIFAGSAESTSMSAICVSFVLLFLCVNLELTILVLLDLESGLQWCSRDAGLCCFVSRGLL